MALEPLLRAEDVARILGRHRMTVLQMAKDGTLSYVRLGVRGIRFRGSDVEAYIARCAVGPAA